MLGQDADTQRSPGNFTFVEKSTSRSGNSAANGYAKGNEIFFESFASLDGWTVSNSSEPELNWIHTTDETLIPYPELSPFLSSSINDGFALVNANEQGQNSIQNCSLTLNSPLDLSNFSNVYLQFEQNTRNYQTTYSIRISPNGGESWNTFDVNSHLDNNTNSENPEIVRIDISEVAGGSNNVLIEFNYSAEWGWHWAIDNLIVAEINANDLSLKSAYYDRYIDYLEDEDIPDSEYLRETEYSNYHNDQVRPLSFLAKVENVGAETQTDVVLTAELTDPSGSTSLYSSTPAIIESGVDTILRIDDIMPDAFNGGTDATTGEYSIVYTIDQLEEDENADNTAPIERNFMVNGEYVASDLGEEWSGYYPLLGEGVIWASRYTFEQEAEIEYISFGVLSIEGAESQPGDSLYLNIRTGSVFDSGNDENPTTRLFGDTELLYVLNEGDFTTDDEMVWINFMLPEPIQVFPDSIYQGEVEVPSNSSNYLWLPFSNNQSEKIGVLFDESNPSDLAQGWWDLEDNNPNIRLGLDFILGTQSQNKLEFKLGQNYPNPTSGSTRVEWELFEPADNVDFRITDSLGRTVYWKDLGNRPAGKQETLELNLNLAAGTYQYALQVGNQIIVKKMIILK